MIILEEYIKLDKITRQSYIDLTEPCLERGGDSTNHRGVLAQYLNSTIRAKGVLLCHACNNGACSNPKHLYWGTYKENNDDAFDCGARKTAWEYTIEKYGYEEACNRNKRDAATASKLGKVGGSKLKSESHKKAISEAIKKKYAGVGESADPSDSKSDA